MSAPGVTVGLHREQCTGIIKIESVCLQTFWSLFLSEKVCIAQEKFYSEPQLFSGDWGAGASVPPAPPSLCLQPTRELLEHILKILAQFVSFNSQSGKQRHREAREWTMVTVRAQLRRLLFSGQGRGRTGRKSKTRSSLRNWAGIVAASHQYVNEMQIDAKQHVLC